MLKTILFLYCAVCIPVTGLAQETEAVEKAAPDSLPNAEGAGGPDPEQEK